MVCFLGEPQLICILIMLPTTFHPPRVPLHPGCTKCGHRPAATSLPGVRDHDPRPQPPHTESESTALKSLRHFCHHQHVKSGKPPRPSYLRTGVRSGGKGPEQDMGSQDKHYSLQGQFKVRGAGRPVRPLGGGSSKPPPICHTLGFIFCVFTEMAVCGGASRVPGSHSSSSAELAGTAQGSISDAQAEGQTNSKQNPSQPCEGEGAGSQEQRWGTPALLSQREP